MIENISPKGAILSDLIGIFVMSFYSFCFVSVQAMLKHCSPSIRLIWIKAQADYDMITRQTNTVFHGKVEQRKFERV